MSNPNLNPTKQIIPVNVAVAKTTYWREFMADLAPEADQKQLPKGVYISKEDMQELAAYCSADEEALGVRVYFTLENSHKEAAINQVKFVMVLVKNSKLHPHGQDLLYIPPGADMMALSPDGGDLDDSNIYDFTQPCPETCDVTSDLYDNNQPGRPFRRKAQ